MIATGGTIASKSSAHGLHPALTSEDLLLSVPEVSDICEVDTIQLMNLDSTDITPADWLQMADTIEKTTINMIVSSLLMARIPWPILLPHCLI